MAGELLCPLLPRPGGGGCAGTGGGARSGHTPGSLAPCGPGRGPAEPARLGAGRRLGKRENVRARAGVAGRRGGRRGGAATPSAGGCGGAGAPRRGKRGVGWDRLGRCAVGRPGGHGRTWGLGEGAPPDASVCSPLGPGVPREGGICGWLAGRGRGGAADEEVRTEGSTMHGPGSRGEAGLEPCGRELPSAESARATCPRRGNDARARRARRRGGGGERRRGLRFRDAREAGAGDAGARPGGSWAAGRVPRELREELGGGGRRAKASAAERKAAGTRGELGSCCCFKGERGL